MTLLIFTSAYSFGHGVISGRIITSSMENAIPNALITLSPGERFTYADERGYYRFGDLQAGTFTLSVLALGYSQTKKDIVLAENESKEINISLLDKAISMSEVVITPGKELGLTAISSLDLKLRPVNNTQDLLRLVPGLFIAQHAGGGKAEQIFLRGFDVDHGTDVAVSVDGMPVNMVSHAHGQGYADLHFVIPELVGNMNFSKGPYDAKTGNLNTAGAVRFFTRNYLPRSFVKLEGGMFGMNRAVTGINLFDNGDSSNRRQNAYVAAEYTYSNGFFNSPQNFRRINVLGKYNLSINRNTDLSLSLSHFVSSWNASGQIPERSVNDGSISRFGSIDPTEGGNTSRQNINLILTKTLDNGAVFRNQLFYSHYTFNLFSNFTFLLEDSINGDQIQQYEDRNIFGYNGSYSITHKLGRVEVTSLIGASLRDDQIGNIKLARTQKRKFIYDIKAGEVYETNLAGYFEETFKISPKLTATLGGRLDVFRFLYNSSLTDTLGSTVTKAIASPKLNVYYNITPKVQIYTSLGTGFHSFDARSASSVPGGNVLPRANGADVGVNFKVSEKLFVNAAAWILELQNEFVYVGDAGIVEPSGKSRRTGIDFSGRYQITEFLYADCDLTLANPKLTTEPEGAQNVPLAPRFTSIGGLSFRKNGWMASLRYRYMGDRPANEDNSIVAHGYTIVDAVINYQTGNYVFSASAENLLNVKWKEAQFATESRLRNETASVEEIHYTPGTPFFVKAGVTYSF